MKLYIKFKSTELDDNHEFEEGFSGLYEITEYKWTGYLKKGWKFTLVDEDGDMVPFYGSYNEKGGPGFTFEDAATINQLKVKNALMKEDFNFVYYFTNEESYLEYTGKFRKVTMYVRIYDNQSEDRNNRWVCLNLQ